MKSQFPSILSNRRNPRKLRALIERLEERIAPATFTVTTTADSGAGSLRQAILNANGDAVLDTIVFNIPGSGPHTIQPLTPLPTVSTAMIINGATEPGYSDHPLIEIDGSLTNGANGFNISAASVTLRALTINSFDATGISITGAGGTQILGCFVGVDTTGTVAQPNTAHGIVVQAPNCVIGGDTAQERNVISGNAMIGLFINGATSTNATVTGNYIGTNLLASLQIPNGSQGIAITNGGDHTIGGSTAALGNVISGNGGDDISLSNSNGNVIAGNIIGLDLPMKVELQSKGHGILITGTSANNLVGGTVAGARNVIAGHDELASSSGVSVTGNGTGNTILGNLIGTNPSGDDELGNVYGILVGAPGTVIGDLAGHGNLVAGNNGYGIFAYNGSGLQVLGNRVGIYQVANDFPRANGSHGIYLDGPDNAVIKGNIASGNAGDGIQIRNSDNTIVQGNFCGTNAGGTLTRPNGLSGIAVVNCAGVTIGGPGVGEGNVISGNAVYGLYIFSNSPVNVYGNMIGTNAAGNSVIPNVSFGVFLDGGTGHRIGGASAGMGNLISGNGGGVGVDTGGGIIQGNIIGLNAAGTAKLANQGNAGGHGIQVFSGSDTLIGGNQPGEGNVIAGNGGSGIYIGGTGIGAKVLGNLIGTNAAGAAGLGNGGGNGGIHTIVIAAADTTIGGPTAADRNIIASGSGRAIHLINAPDALIQGNWIGLAPDGNTARGNASGIGLSGVDSDNATIVGNVISGNATWAIAAQDNSGHVIEGNRIGTNAAGTAAVGNGQQGIILTNETNITVGGSSPGSANLISGNGGDAILLTGGKNIAITGNLIGTNAAGTAAIGNFEGVSINGSVIQANGIAVTGNTISGTTGSAMNFFGALTNVTVQSNRMGLQANGSGFLPNGRGMGVNSTSGLLIGGTAAQGNEIAGNAFEGIYIYGAASGGISILSNNIHHNGGSGIRLENNGTPILVGGTSGNGNNVHQNGGAGVHLTNSNNGAIAGNSIANNLNVGVLIEGASTGNVLGGDAAAAGNTISANALAGIAVTGGSGNRITRNSIFSNGGLAIDLGATGSTANDIGDADTGPNGLQNAPTLSGAALVPGGNTIILGSVQSAANTHYRLEFFSGVNGAAQHFLATADFTTGPDGTISFELDLGAVVAGESVVATATEVATGNTSELRVLDAAPSVPTLSINNVTVTETDSGNIDAVFTVTLSSTPTLPVTFDFGSANGTAELLEDFVDFGGQHTFAAGTQNLTVTITVPVLGEDLAEAVESFFVKLTNGQNVLILDDSGEGTIVNDDTTLFIDPKFKGKVATWRDLDGDLVTLKASKGILTADDFVFIADGNGGEQLAALLLSDDGAIAAKSNLSLVAKRASQNPLGDGRANLGFLDASGVDLGSIVISGDLGRIEAGDNVAKTPGMKSLMAGSMGFFGVATQADGGNLLSEIKGGVGNVKIRGDFALARFHATGSVGSVAINGSMSGGADPFSGSFRVDGKLGSFLLGGSLSAGSGPFTGFVESGGAMGGVMIKGSVTDGAQIASGGSLRALVVGGDISGIENGPRAMISAAGKIGNVKIGGSVSHAQLLAGFTSGQVAVNADATIGPVKVADNWIASDMVAGIDPGLDGDFGTADDAPATSVLPFVDAAKTQSKIARIQIGGYVAGSSADSTDRFIFAAQRIGQLSVGGLAYVLNGKTADTLTLGADLDVLLNEVG